MTIADQDAPKRWVQAFYSATVADFLDAPAELIVGRLTSAHVAFHASAEADQVRAWSGEIQLLKSALRDLGPAALSWGLLLEVPLLRLGKRLDAVVLAPGIVVAVEFKMGAVAYDGSHRVQTEMYGASLRDFHQVSQTQLIVPVLCAENAPAKPLALTETDGVADILYCNGSTLIEVLRLVQSTADPAAEATSTTDFVRSSYRPTPTIVEAAQALYAGHKIADIGRGDAADEALQATGEALSRIVEQAALSRSKVICFVTGAPGAGKTLLGLDLALRSRGSENPAALLSGNRPLVHVLTEALAEDSARRTGGKKGDAKYQASAAIQNLLAYLKAHTEGSDPPENVIVFDEAQRAWDADVGMELMGRPSSEPDLFLEILDRLEWACLVCLVGPGQEINRGEGGLPLWGEALAAAAADGRSWRVIAAPQALNGGPDVAGAGLLSGGSDFGQPVQSESLMHLANGIRAYRNPLQGRWVAALLEGRIDDARQVADQMDHPPAWITRDLDTARTWLRAHRRGGRSVGLLASSAAVRLLGEGIPPTLRSNELGPIGHWFLKPHTDFRSSGALEVPMSEYGCQGLELDYVGLCWGGDLIWSGDTWVPRTMSSPKWQIIRNAEKMRFRLNSYRVLLTRGRAGVVIYIPEGSDDDATRSRSEANSIARALEQAGCVVLTS